MLAGHVDLPAASSSAPPSRRPSAARLKPPDDNGGFIKHPDLWFFDGSIVLRARTTLFRVHMSQLSRKSTFFRDMCAFPLPKDHEDQVDRFEGCPLLDLQDDPEDLANLLKVLYDGPYFGNNDRTDFRAVSGILRLSTKYLMDAIRSKALAHLQIAWPPTLRGWDAREDIARIYEYENKDGETKGHRYPHPMDVINLAREIDVDALLPSAFYDLSRHPFVQIYEPDASDALHRAPPPALSPGDTRRLALGKEAAHGAITALIQSMPHCTSARADHARTFSLDSGASGRGLARARPLCTTPAACRADFEELRALATQHYLFDRERGCADPLYVAEELGQLKSEGADGAEEACVACARALEVWAGKERERMWRALGGWFRLR